MTAWQKDSLRPICLVIAITVRPSGSALRRDRASIVLDGVEVDDVSVRRQLAALMQRNRGLDQSRIAPADQVEKHCDLPLAPHVVDCASRVVGSR